MLASFGRRICHFFITRLSYRQRLSLINELAASDIQLMASYNGSPITVHCGKELCNWNLVGVTWVLNEDEIIFTLGQSQ